MDALYICALLCDYVLSEITMTKPNEKRALYWILDRGRVSFLSQETDGSLSRHDVLLTCFLTLSKDPSGSPGIHRRILRNLP